MDTEPTGDSGLSVALPPSLHEWLDERADALGIEREALFVQLLETHRAAAEFDSNGSESLFESVGNGHHTPEDVDARFEAIDERVADIEARTTEIGGRVDELDAKHTNTVEDLRGRVLQLRDAVRERAPAEHTHEEFEALSDRIETLGADRESTSDELADIETALEETTGEIDTIVDRLEGVDEKLDRLAHAVIANKRRAEAGEPTGAVDELRRAANRHGVTTADCAGCGGSVRISLLTEPTCPHCARRLRELDASSSPFGWFTSATLTVVSERSEASDA